MRRRTFVTGLTAGLVGLSGCLGEAAPETDTSVTDSQSAATETGGSELSITRTHVYSHAVRLNNLGTAPHGDIPSVGSLEDREQEVVQKALDGTYTTDSVPAWLANFTAGTTYIRDGSEYYRLDASLPTTTITAEPTDRDAVSGKIASYEEYETAVTHDGVIQSGLLRSARQGSEELTYVWPSLQSFLDSYAAVELYGDLFSISVTTTDPGPPYTVAATPVSLSELADGSVWRLSTAHQSVQELVREAAEKSGLHAFDNPEGNVIKQLRDHRYVYVDGEFHTTYVEQTGTPPISVAATLDPQAAESETTIRLTLQNNSSNEVRIMSGAPKPFGVLSYHEQDSNRRAGVLWTPAYEESRHVETTGREVGAVNAIGVSTTISPNGSTGRSFTIDPESLSAGEYRVADSVGYDTGEERGTVPYSVEFTISNHTDK